VEQTRIAQIFNLKEGIGI